MAWRIHEHVVRGEIDNRERGIVRGRIWLAGYPDPVVIDLKGNASPDLAGCLLTFENPDQPMPAKPDECIALVQRGAIGDLTASRKVRVFDLPVAEAYMRLKNKLPVSEHMANCLYLEWFSERNGRVVIETTDFQLSISPPSWRLTPEDEAQRAADAAAGFSDFMQNATDAVETVTHFPEEDREWNEFDYEKLFRESDARADKLEELIDKYMDHPDRDRIIAREMGWVWETEDDAGEEVGETLDDAIPETETGAEEELEDFTDLDPAKEGVDWIRNRYGDIVHPLCDRARESVVAFWHKLNELGLEATGDSDLRALREEYQITAAKLAGALNSVARNCRSLEAAFIVACLKRALSHLHSAQAAFQRVAAKNLIPSEALAPLRSDMFAIREEMLRLMTEYRKK